MVPLKITTGSGDMPMLKTRSFMVMMTMMITMMALSMMMRMRLMMSHTSLR